MTPSATSSWYLLQSRPRLEVVAEQSLHRLGIEVLLPRIRENRVIRRRPCTVTGPLFPGYLFGRFDVATQFRAASYAHGVRRVVTFGDDLAVVTPDIVEGIRARLQDGAVLVRPAPKPGDRVRVEWGPLEGLEAVFERELSDQQRVVLLFQRLAYQARVVVEADQVVNL